MTPAAVSDAGPVIHLAEIDSLDLLSVFDPLLIPDAVYGELENGGVPPGLADLQYDVVEADGGEDQAENLDAGERAALAVANDRNILLLTDDLAARKYASRSGIEVHGSIGVITYGVNRGLLGRDEAETRMRAIQRETSLFVTDAVVERGIELLDEA